jgi:3',5'-cyclic AMP phosphodiesterase CpdA
MPEVFRLAHVTDPHFRSFVGARMGDFLGKRAIGALNLVVNRRRMHKMELLAALGADLRRERPDHVALTGDLSNVSLDAEWHEALRWIEALGAAPQDVTVIPGNHDAYVAEVVVSRAFEKLFARYQTADLLGAGAGTNAGAGADGGANADYPFVRFRGPLALVSVNSCVATGDLGAWGEIGADQLARLEAALASPDLSDRVRVVLIHHPPVRHKGGEDRNLKDRRAFSDLLGRVGADLVLHGHDHRDEKTAMAGPAGQAIPIVGAGSASYAGGPDRRARYNLYEFDGPAITLVVRAHDEATDTFREVRRERLG